MKDCRADVLVLGAGVIGLSCAWYLLQAGRSVTVLEQGTAGCGSSHGNCGTLTPSHALPLPAPGVIGLAVRSLLHPAAPLRIRPRLDLGLLRWLLSFAGHANAREFRAASLALAPLLQRSRTLIEELVRDENLACEFEASGTLDVYRDPRGLDAALRQISLLKDCGVTVEAWSPAEIAAREPTLKPGLAGGLFHPGDARLRPDRYAAELARCVRQRGGAILEEHRVSGFIREGGHLEAVQVGSERFVGREVVLALGAWSPRFARQLGLCIPIQPGKGYSITWSRPSPCPRLPLTLKEPQVCVSSWESGYRLGSTMEFAGYDTSLNQRRLDALRRGAAEYLHVPEGPAKIEEWYGWRPMTPDDLPMIGRAPHLDNLVLATGHGMLGVSLSAVTGLLVSEIIAGRRPSLDIDACSPARFG